MTSTETVAYLRIRCATCGERFVPNYLEIKQELLIVCPHCLTPYLPPKAQIATAPLAKVVPLRSPLEQRAKSAGRQA